MAPHMNDQPVSFNSTSGDRDGPLPKPRLVIIGAGSRGSAYARATVESGLGIIAAVVDPIPFKRKQLGSKYIWPVTGPSQSQEFETWAAFIAHETSRRRDSQTGDGDPEGFDGVFICVRDEQHVDVLTAIAPLGLHIMSEKPLATTLKDCLRIERALKAFPPRVFGIGHVLRYSPHNMLLRHLLLADRVIGDVLSIEHVEPVGFWHFSHSYVRGHWRKESTTAPSLLTKSCHDIDFLLWLLCSPGPNDRQQDRPHLPTRISSVGSLKQFRRSQKPPAAGHATNCLTCPIERTCKFSAPRIYNDRHLAKGNALWPVDIVNPEVGSILETSGPDAARTALMASLSEDYTSAHSIADIEERPWFGRCVWECDNDVVDDQHVLVEWDDDEHDLGRSAKTASFHMIAQTLAQCERRGRIYGTCGEMVYNSREIVVHNFENDTTRTYTPEVPKNSHHGGGDQGLTQQFILAVANVMAGRSSVREAQTEIIGCTIDDVVRSHLCVFAAEEARRTKKVVEWREWWERMVEMESNESL